MCMYANLALILFTYTGWPKKTGPVCFIANILKTPRPTCVQVGELLQYCMLNAGPVFLGHPVVYISSCQWLTGSEHLTFSCCSHRFAITVVYRVSSVFQFVIVM